MFSSRPKDKFAYNFGVSVFHIAAPRESFLFDENNRINRRFVAHGSIEINAGYDNQWTVSPTVLFMMQGQAQQYNFGVRDRFKRNCNNQGGRNLHNHSNTDHSDFCIRSIYSEI